MKSSIPSPDEVITPEPQPINGDFTQDINDIRLSNGSTHVTNWDRLDLAAKFQADWLAKQDHGPSHDGPPLASELKDRLTRAGVKIVGEYGEVADGGYPFKMSCQRWLESRGENPLGLTHRKILLGKQYKRVGTASSVAESGTIYNVAVFTSF